MHEKTATIQSAITPQKLSMAAESGVHFHARSQARFKRLILTQPSSSVITHCARMSPPPGTQTPAETAFLEQTGCSPESALELAVSHNDILLAREALQQGADPEKISAAQADDEMRALLTYARRKNKLYPPNAASGAETDLDRALRNGLDDDDRKQAEDLLHQTRLGRGTRQLWRDAVKENRPDIQRAILLLGKADEDCGFRLLQEESVQDKGVIEVMKEIPYHSPKRGEPDNLNGKAIFPDTDEEILCRHLVTYRQKVQERDPQIKFDNNLYESAQAIARNVPSATEAEFEHLLAHAAEAHLFHNRDFGKMLSEQFTAMADDGEKTRLITLLSPTHAMSVGLKLKITQKDGELRRYAAEFFDPNQTTSHVRVASGSLCTFETLALKNCISEKFYKSYYPGTNGLSMMLVRPAPKEEPAMASPVQGAAGNRTLTSSIEDKDIDATALWYMLTIGFAGDLRRLRNEIARRPEEERLQLLAAKNGAGTSGLFMALKNGRADAIKAFGEWLEELVPPEMRAELLAAKTADGIPGLYRALQEGRAEAIKAFGELLELVPLEMRAELLAAKTADGLPGLFMALQEGHADAIKAFGELLELVPPEMRAELLAAKNDDGIPGLYKALQEGRADAIKAFGELLEMVPPEMRAELVAAKNASGLPGLYRAMQEEGHAEAIKAFGELLKLVPPEMRADLVAAKNADGVSALYRALQGRCAEAIKAFGELLELVPSEMRAELLAAKIAGGTSGLYRALQNGRADAIAAFGELLELVPPEMRAELVAAKNANGVPGFIVALQNGHADAIKALGKLLSLVPPQQRAVLLDTDANPELFQALQDAPADARKAFEELTGVS